MGNLATVRDTHTHTKIRFTNVAKLANNMWFSTVYYEFLMTHPLFAIGGKWGNVDTGEALNISILFAYPL